MASPDQYFEGLKAMPYSERVQSAIALGKKAAAGDPNGAALVQALQASTSYEHQLVGLQLCLGSLDAAFPLSMLRSTSCSLRELAYKVTTNVATNDQLLEVLMSTPLSELRTTLKRLHGPHKGRRSVLQAVVDRAAERGDRKLLAVALLFGSEQQIRAHWKTVEAEVSTVDWSRLSTYHPTLAAEYVEAWQQDTTKLAKIAAVLPGVAAADPPTAWRLYMSLATKQRAELMSACTYQPARAALMKFFPERLVALNLQTTSWAQTGVSSDEPSTKVYSQVQAISTEMTDLSKHAKQLSNRCRRLEISQLLQAVIGEWVELPQVLARLAIDQRAALFDGWRDWLSHQSQQLEEVHKQLSTQVGQAGQWAVQPVAAPAAAGSSFAEPVVMDDAKQQQQQQQQAALKSSVLYGLVELREMADALRQHAYRPWLSSGPLPRLPSRCRLKLLQDVLQAPAANSLWLRPVAQESWLKAKSLEEQASLLPAAELATLLEGHHSALLQRVEAGVLHKWFQKLTGEQQCRVLLACSRHASTVAPLSEMATHGASALATAVRLSNFLTAEATAAGLADAYVKRTGVTVIGGLKAAVDTVDAATRSELLTLLGSNPMRWLVASKLVSRRCGEAKPEALDLLHDELAKWWSSLKGAMGGAWSGALRSSAPELLEAMQLATMQEAFEPWLLDPSLPGKHLVAMVVAASADAPKLLHSAMGSGSALVKALTALPTATLQPLAAAAPPPLLLALPSLLSALPDEQREALLAGPWRARRTAVEGALLSLLSAPQAPTLSAALAGKAKRLLLADPLIVAGPPDEVSEGDGVQAALWSGGRAAWLSVSALSPALLPEPHRTTVARARIALVDKDMAPAAQLQAIASLLPLLPWNEVVEHPVLRQQLGSKVPTDRTTAWEFIFDAIKLQPAHLGKALQLMHARRNEQDPVRQVILLRLGALVQAAGAEQRYKLADHIPAIQVVISDAWGAKDLSESSIKAITGSIIEAQLPVRPVWALQQVAAAIAVHGFNWGWPVKPQAVTKHINTLGRAVLNAADELQKQFGGADAARRLAAESGGAEPSASAALPLKRKRGDADDAGGSAAAEAGSTAAAAAAALAAQASAVSALESYLLQLAEGNDLVLGALKKLAGGPALSLALQVVQGQWELASEAAKLKEKPAPGVTQPKRKTRDNAAALAAAAAGTAVKPASASDALPWDFWASPVRQRLLQVVYGTLVPMLASTDAVLFTVDGYDGMRWLAQLLLPATPQDVPPPAAASGDGQPAAEKHAFLQVSHHLVPEKLHNSGHDSLVAADVVPLVPVGRLDLLQPFLIGNSSMPITAISALVRMLKQMRRHGRSDAVTAAAAGSSGGNGDGTPVGGNGDGAADGGQLAAIDALLCTALEQDASLVQIPVVCKHLFRHRQDLLAPLLQNAKFTSGMFGERAKGLDHTTAYNYTYPPIVQGDLQWALSRDDGSTYWLTAPKLPSPFVLTGAQQVQLAESLVSLIRSGAVTDVRDQQKLIDRIAALPAVPASLLLSLTQGVADNDSKATMLRDCILQSLTNLDNAEQACTELIRSVQAGVGGPALSAIGTLMVAYSKGAHCDFTVVMERLRALPWKQPAAMREVLRILGKMAPTEPRAYAELANIAETRAEAQHPSVIVHFLGVMQAFLDRAEAQALFKRAAASEGADVASAAAVVPAAELLKAPGVVDHVVAVFNTLLEHPEQRVRVEAMRVWGDASSVMPLESGLPVAQRLLAISRSEKTSSYEAGMANESASSYFARVVAAAVITTRKTRDDTANAQRASPWG